jgi:hypothetical protein
MGKQVVLALTGTLWLGATPVSADSCMDEIVSLERKLADAKSNPSDQPTGVQSIDAQLSRPTSPELMAQAEARADEAVRVILNRARAFDAENKTSECEAAVVEAKLHFGPQ